MKYCQMIDRLTKILANRKLEYKDTIIIGDNSSGKSDILKQLIENDAEGVFYFIDAVNRYFNVAQIMPNPIPNIAYSTEISKCRIKEENFNQRDSFYYKGTPRAVEELYANYVDEITEMMEEFLTIKFDIKQGEVGLEVYIDEEEVTLSSGYQALMRIFLETIYFASTRETGTIVIDEIDEFLSVSNSGRILGFLRNKFPKLNFFVTTHSADLIAHSENINLVLLENQNFEIVDAGDFASISQVYDIFEAVLGKSVNKSHKQQTDETLRMLLNNKIAGVWERNDEALLQEIKSRELTRAQRLIIRQIEAW